MRRFTELLTLISAFPLLQPQNNPQQKNAQLTIDDVAFFGMSDADSVALASSSAKIVVGHDATINVSAASGAITWSTSDANIVTFVGSNTAVTLTGVGVGTATITATVGTAKAT